MASLDLREGMVVGGRYRIVRPLSAGAMGAVFVAEHITTKKQRALKVMQPELVGDAKLRERFAQEAQIGAQIESEHIVEVIDAGVDDDKGMPWLAMELLSGETLGQLAAREGALGPGFVRDVLEQLCHAVGAAHDEGVVHRDLKPDNVFLAGAKRVGGPFIVKVLDFGIAKLVSEAHTRFTAAIGTPLYMSPEQMSPGSSIGAPSDVWAIGLITFQLLTGKHYWRSAHDDASSSLMLLNEVTTLPLEKASVRAASLDCASLPPDGFDAWFERCVAREPGDRWADAHAAWKALDAILSAAPRGRYPEVTSTPRRAPRADDAAIGDLATDAFLERRNTSGVSPDAPTEIPSLSVPTPVTDLSSSSSPVSEATASSRADASSTTHAALGATMPVGKTDAVDTPAPRLSRTWLALGAVALAGGVVFLATRGPSGTGANAGTPSASAVASAAPGEKLVVKGVDCRDATLEGDGVSPELAHALGVGACARFGVEIGAEWRDKQGEPLLVSGKLSASGAEITTTIGGRSATAEGKTAIKAVIASVAKLAASVEGPVPTPDEIAGWGAKDAAGARRIARAWYRDFSTFEPDKQTVLALLETDPDSPWTHLLWAGYQPRDSELFKSELERTLALAETLPPARAKALRGNVLFQRANGTDQQDGLGLVRRTYAEAPDDPQIAGFYSYMALAWRAPEEGFAVTDRLYERWPTKSATALWHAVETRDDHDLVREEKYLLALREVLPETAGGDRWVLHQIEVGRFDDARAALALGDKLGKMPANDSDARYCRAEMYLLEGRTKEARDEIAPLIGSPDPSVVAMASEALVGSYYLEGRLVDAESAELRQLERIRSSGTEDYGPWLVPDIIRVHRWMKKPPPSAKLVDSHEAWAKKERGIFRAYAITEIALARGDAEPSRRKKIASEALDEIKKLVAEVPEGERQRMDSIRIQSIPLVRIVRGAEEAAQLWRDTTRAIFPTRRRSALDAGLALEAVGDKDAALAAYRLSQDLVALEGEGFATLTALVKEATLLHAMKRDAEAKPLDEKIDRLMAHADPGVREAIDRLK